MSRFCSLFSSSTGNCTYIGTARESILIDAGVSAKKITNALTDRGVEPESIRGIFITHEHSDHVNGLRVLASRYHIPVYATAGTIRALEDAGTINGKFPVFELSAQGQGAGDMFIRFFHTPHDCSESCGYTVEMPDGRKIAIATDIGHITNEIMNAISGSDLAMIESNHDVGMLMNGDYPYMLKRRILSDKGHLCNEKCAEMASQLIRSGTTRFFLGHLSEHNNLPDLAFRTTYTTLLAEGAELDLDYMLTVNPKENGDSIVKF